MTAAWQEEKCETENRKAPQKTKTRSYQPNMKRDDCVCEWLFAVKLHVSIAGCNHVDSFAAAVET